MQFYMACITFFKEEHMELLKATCGPMLELVHRLYTDDSLSGLEVKDVAAEIIDTLSHAFDEKSFFIQTFNEVQQGITKTRQERKQTRKLMAGRTDDIAV